MKKLHSAMLQQKPRYLSLDNTSNGPVHEKLLKAFKSLDCLFYGVY